MWRPVILGGKPQIQAQRPEGACGRKVGSEQTTWVHVSHRGPDKGKVRTGVLRAGVGADSGSFARISSGPETQIWTIDWDVPVAICLAPV